MGLSRNRNPGLTLHIVDNAFPLSPPMAPSRLLHQVLITHPLLFLLPTWLEHHANVHICCFFISVQSTDCTASHMFIIVHALTSISVTACADGTRTRWDLRVVRTFPAASTVRFWPWTPNCLANPDLMRVVSLYQNLKEHFSRLILPNPEQRVIWQFLGQLYYSRRMKLVLCHSEPPLARRLILIIIIYSFQ